MARPRSWGRLWVWLLILLLAFVLVAIFGILLILDRQTGIMEWNQRSQHQADIERAENDARITVIENILRGSMEAKELAGSRSGSGERKSSQD